MAYPGFLRQDANNLQFSQISRNAHKKLWWLGHPLHPLNPPTQFQKTSNKVILVNVLSKNG